MGLSINFWTDVWVDGKTLKSYQTNSIPPQLKLITHIYILGLTGSCYGPCLAHPKSKFSYGSVLICAQSDEDVNHLFQSCSAVRPIIERATIEVNVQRPIIPFQPGRLKIRTKLNKKNPHAITFGCYLLWNI
ncbi:hypothetical protein AQUCO_01800244v1 [Aquilegia coerulea]|uniref:Uncharacterized protein n=1 Tax=Aquilegia coerulea TaxID=218851 RepID=A0A2G5DKL4_AQUCA|nr:hypothetical protein AQUCO_01800244v1 [Aquilegia coerulea]